MSEPIVYSNGVRVHRSAQDRAQRRADIEAAFRERDERLARVNSKIEEIEDEWGDDYDEVFNPYNRSGMSDLDRLYNEREVLENNITEAHPMGWSYRRVMNNAASRGARRNAPVNRLPVQSRRRK